MFLFQVFAPESVFNGGGGKSRLLQLCRCVISFVFFLCFWSIKIITMSFNGLPSNLQTLLCSLIEEHGLSSYKLCSNPCATTVILRFVNMEDRPVQETNRFKQTPVSWRQKSHSECPTRHTFVNKATSTQNSSADSTFKSVSSQPTIEKTPPLSSIHFVSTLSNKTKAMEKLPQSNSNNKNECRPAGFPTLDTQSTGQQTHSSSRLAHTMQSVNKQLALSSVHSSVHSDYLGTSDDVVETYSNSPVYYSFTKDRVTTSLSNSDPAVSNTKEPKKCVNQTVSHTNTLDSDSHHWGSPTITSTLASPDGQRDTCDTQQHIEENLVETKTENGNTALDFKIGTDGSKPATEICSYDLFGESNFLVRCIGRLPEDAVEKLRDRSRNRSFKRIVTDPKDYSSGYLIMAVTDDFLIEMDPQNGRITDFFVIPDILPTFARRRLQRFYSLSEYNYTATPNELLMFKKATVDLMNFVYYCHQQKSSNED